MQRAGVFVFILMALVFLSSCNAGEKGSDPETGKSTSTTAVQQDDERFLERFLSEDHRSVQMKNLEWGMTLDNVLEALDLAEDTYSIIRQDDSDPDDPVSQIIVSEQIAIGQISVEMIRVFAFMDDALYLGEYSMAFEQVEDMVAVCVSLQDQIELLNLDNRLLRIPSSYDRSLGLLNEDRVRACYEGKEFGELFWVGTSSNEFHIAIPESEDPGSNHTLIILVESGQIPHL